MYLLTAKLSVEEKNEIRWVLHKNYRPLLFSMNDSDTEDIFKKIKVLPAPKPWVIERDIKVFCWKDLERLLKNVIGKYVSLFGFRFVSY
jgi:hypothetical protein